MTRGHYKTVHYHPYSSWCICRAYLVLGAERRLAREKSTEGVEHKLLALSYIDDVNGARVAEEEEMNVALSEAAREARIRWDQSKHWRGKGGKIPRGDYGRPAETPEISGPEGEGSLGSSETVKQAETPRETKDCDPANAPDPDIRI